MSSTSSVVYSGLATYGQIHAIISMVIVGIIAILAVAIGIYLATRTPMRTASTKGKIVSISSSVYDVTYSVNGKIYTTTINGYNSSNYVNEKVTVHYQPSNPRNARVGMSKRLLGFILILTALFIAGLTALITYFTFKSKTFAAFEGGSEAIGQLARL